MVPSKPLPVWFKSLDSSISTFLWKTKPTCIRLNTLQKASDCGGLELPYFYN